MRVVKLTIYLAEDLRVRRFRAPSVALQTATVLGLAALFAGFSPDRADAQAVGRIEVQATVVDVSASRTAVAAARWLLGQKRDVRKERGLATIVVSREKRQVAINYLKN
jgi:hypothetical protein